MTSVILLLFGDINNSYPQIFSPAILSPTLIEKFKMLLIWMLFFLFLFIGLKGGDVTLSATIFYSFCRCMQWSLARADLLLSPLSLSTCEDNCPFSQKATSIYLENFPPIEETWIFLSDWESKICWYKKIYLFDLSGAWTQNQT